HGERPDAPVEGGRPRSGDGALLRPAQFPGTPKPLAAYNLIGINSNGARDMACSIRRDTGDQLPPFDGFDVPFDENRNSIHAMLLSHCALQRTLHPTPSAKYARSQTG